MSFWLYAVPSYKHCVVGVVSSGEGKHKQPCIQATRVCISSVKGGLGAWWCLGWVACAEHVSCSGGDGFLMSCQFLLLFSNLLIQRCEVPLCRVFVLVESDCRATNCDGESQDHHEQGTLLESACTEQGSDKEEHYAQQRSFQHWASVRSSSIWWHGSQSLCAKLRYLPFQADYCQFRCCLVHPGLNTLKTLDNRG